MIAKHTTKMRARRCLSLPSRNAAGTSLSITPPDDDSVTGESKRFTPASCLGFGLSANYG
jgi:hypothetical protein